MFGLACIALFSPAICVLRTMVSFANDYSPAEMSMLHVLCLASKENVVVCVLMS